MSRLAGSLFKVIWADEHLELVKRYSRAYIATNPYYFPTEQQGDMTLVSKAEIMRSPDSRLWGSIGDCVTNLMAALDYISWELAVRHAGRPVVPPPRGTDKPSFPLYSDPLKYDAAIPQRLKRYNIPDVASDLIKSVQPYNAGYEPLALLYVLVNQDKHRLPLVTKGQVDSGDIRIIHGGAYLTAQSAATSVAFQTPSPSDLARAGRDVKVDAQVTTFVAFQDPTMPREPVEIILGRIRDCVDRVVNAFIPIV
ncbi:MAG: hypothetical protein HY275_10095 [Gemmatimonadetes bacterium]|nr:hypothetical protein [Gemmatimonadota bacterium]